jgi:glycosyltransferase involved in cell wall biosynthesis
VVDGPLVSVVVPSWDEEKYIGNCLASVNHQTYQNLEVIVVDSSSDRTPYIAESYGAGVVRVPEGNVSYARNQGARTASGSTLFFLDADCIIAHDCIERLASALMPGTVLTHGSHVVYDDGVHTLYWAVRNLLVPKDYTDGRDICIRTEAFWGIGGFDEGVNPLEGNREDIDLGKRIVARFGPGAIRMVYSALVGLSVRREKAYGYRMWKVPRVRRIVVS